MGCLDSASASYSEKKSHTKDSLKISMVRCHPWTKLWIIWTLEAHGEKSSNKHCVLEFREKKKIGIGEVVRIEPWFIEIKNSSFNFTLIWQKTTQWRTLENYRIIQGNKKEKLKEKKKVVMCICDNNAWENKVV